MNKLDQRGAPAPTRELARTLTAVRSGDGSFDVDAWHVMNERDNALISDEMMHGSGSSKFVYQFSLSGTQVTGISVVGARHLASQYGGIKHRLVAAIQKIGELFTFTNYPAPNVPMHVQCSIVPELRDEADFYEAIVEITDIKTGNTIQIQRREGRFETRQNGTSYERLHYATIAQAKAFRNGVLSIVPQDSQIEWKQRMLALDKKDVITTSVIDEKRAGVLKFAAAKAIAVDRRAVEALTMDQISGLSEAARTGSLDAFAQSATALGLMRGAIEAQGQQQRRQEPAPTQDQSRAEPARPAGDAGQTRPAAAAAPPAEQKRESAPTEFEAYLVDEVGEVADDVFTDPKAFIYSLINLANLTTDEKALRAHNADAIEQACEISAEARERYETWVRNSDLVEQTHTPTGGEVRTISATFKPLEVAEVRGKPDWTAYVRTLKEWIGVAVAADIVPLGEFHLPTWRCAPPAQRMLIVKAIVDRCKAAGLTQPDWLAGMMTTAKVAPQTEPPQQQGMPLDEPQQQRREAAPRTAEDETATPERVERWSKRVGAELLAMKTAEEFVAWEDDPDNKERRDLIRQDWPQHSAYVEAAVSGAFQRLMKTAGPAS